MTVNFCNYIHCQAGTSWGPRSLNDCELIYFVSGAVRWSSSQGDSIRIEPHGVLLIPPGECHTLICELPSVISCIHLETEEQKWHLFRPDRQEAARIYGLFRECVREFESMLPERGQMLELLTAEILLRLRRLNLQSRRRRSQLLERLTAYIDTHSEQKLNRRILAEHFGITPEHINYLFHNQLGIPPSHYINRQRVYKAYELLLTGSATLKEIAASVGFDDEYYFGRVFKQIVGISPGRIRKGGY